MGFLDNLENTLKNLERGEEMGDNRQRREAEQATARAASPWAEQLKTSAWTRSLMDQAAASSHRIRAKLYLTWIGSTLRLDVRERRLELRPTSTGILAVILENGAELSSETVDLKGDPAALLERWLAS